MSSLPSNKNKKIVATFTYIKHFEVMQAMALKLNYPFFLWEDKIYDSISGQDTGFLVSDMIKQEEN